ncbi:MAG: nucleoside hydrolase [Chitinophagaceae bacterium]|nr:nucleoside hydrolase [Rubrivivax sp.]
MRHVCGTGPRRDPDDCLALLSLADAAHIDIAGISTVFGNAPISEAHQVTRTLVQVLASEAGRSGPGLTAALPVYKGCGAAASKCLEESGSARQRTRVGEPDHPRHRRDGPPAGPSFPPQRELEVPTLILPSIQVNARAGQLPPPDANGVSYLRIPLNTLPIRP